MDLANRMFNPFLNTTVIEHELSNLNSNNKLPIMYMEVDSTEKKYQIL